MVGEWCRLATRVAGPPDNDMTMSLRALEAHGVDYVYLVAKVVSTPVRRGVALPHLVEVFQPTASRPVMPALDKPQPAAAKATSLEDVHKATERFDTKAAE